MTLCCFHGNTSKRGFPLPRNFYVYVNKLEVMYKRSRVNVEQAFEPRSPFTFTRDTLYIVSVSFTRVNFTSRTGGFPLSSDFNVRTHVNFTGVEKIEAMCGRPSIKVKVERSLTFTCMRDLSYIVSIFFFTRVKFTRQWKSMSRNSSVRTHLKCTCVTEIEAMYERPGAS